MLKLRILRFFPKKTRKEKKRYYNLNGDRFPFTCDWYIFFSCCCRLITHKYNSIRHQLHPSSSKIGLCLLSFGCASAKPSQHNHHTFFSDIMFDFRIACIEWIARYFWEEDNDRKKTRAREKKSFDVWTVHLKWC